MRDVIPQQEFQRRFEAIRKQIVESAGRALAYFDEETNRARLQTRVLCLAEENDCLLMWSHYSASHTGAVFKLNVIDELDVPLLIAKKVTYSRVYPLLATEEELVDHLLYVHRIDFVQRERDLLLVKGDDWHYENEWRVSITDEVVSFGWCHRLQGASGGIRSYISRMPDAPQGRGRNNGIGGAEFTQYGNMEGG
jgi:hypothetical protein